MLHNEITTTLTSLCMGVSDEIAEFKLQQLLILEIKVTIPKRSQIFIFRQELGPIVSTLKMCQTFKILCGKSSRDNIKCLFSLLYNYMCNSQNENVFQIPITLRDKTSFDIQAMILLKDQ